MDGTLTRSRSQIDPVMDAVLSKIGKTIDIVIVSGARLEQIQLQVPAADVYAILAQNGNDAYEPFGTQAWRNELNWMQRLSVLNWIDKARDAVIPAANQDDLVEDRGCQIAYSLIGHHRPIEEKIAFDPKGDKRKQLLEYFPFRSSEVEVRIGGTTCLDFVPIGKNKGTNVAAYAQRKNWKPDECLYIGDALFKGGNDEPVVGVIPTLQVSAPDDTYQYFETLI
jgi:HAD superfamily hydrolase (TIGR01484 family)